MVWTVFLASILTAILQSSPEIRASGQTPVERRLAIHLVVGQTPVDIVALEGGTVRISKIGRPTRGLIPTVSSAGQLDMRIVEISIDPLTGNKVFSELSILHLNLGETLTYDDNGVPLVLQWVDILPPVQTFGDQECAGPDCCVNCGDLEVCACNVHTPCGSCCCANKCPCGTIDRHAGF